jgi:glycosyltransferase involved in cell wall biosynthesis
MKILIHALGASTGGALRHLQNFVPVVCSEDSRISYTLIVRKSMSLKLSMLNVKMMVISDRRASQLLARMIFDYYELPKIIKKSNYDALVCLTNLGPIKASIPYIVYQRDMSYFRSVFVDRNILRRYLAIWTMMAADIVVTPSNAMANSIRKACPQLKPKIFKTIYHGLNQAEFREALKKENGDSARDKTIKIFYPSSPPDYKGYDQLFDILFELKQRGIKALLYLTIDKDEKQRYIKKMHQHGLDDSIIFLGRVTHAEMIQFYQESDLMIFPSLCDSFGFPMLEAMASGLPIVAVDTDLNREICESAALYYPANDCRRGARLVQDLMIEANRFSLVQNARERLNNFDWSWSRNAKEFVQLIHEARKVKK